VTGGYPNGRVFRGLKFSEMLVRLSSNDLRIPFPELLKDLKLSPTLCALAWSYKESFVPISAEKSRLRKRSSETVSIQRLLIFNHKDLSSSCAEKNGAAGPAEFAAGPAVV
jgi:hypothetical protein